MTLVRIVKDWDWPDLLRQTPEATGIWDGIHFTLEPVAECDFLVMLNNRMPHATTGMCPPLHRWMIIQEPYLPGMTDWVMEKHSPFAKVFTHSLPSSSSRYVRSQPALPWHVNKTFDELTQMTIPEKFQKISWVVGNAKDLPGHYLRFSLLDFFRQNAPDIELFGRAVRPIADKWHGIAPFYYSLAIENNSGPDMWTEKLADCFLGWTIPFYYGCTNLEEYFPKDSFIQLDIHDPEKTLATIRENATPENWASRLPALEEARRLILQRYQLFPFLAERIKTLYPPNKEGDKETFVIPPYRRSMNARLLRIRYKLSKKLGLLAAK